MKIYHLLILALISFFYKSNAQSTHHFSTPNFNKLEVGKQLNVELLVSDSCYFAIKGEDFDNEKFAYSVVDGLLTINTKGLKNMYLDVLVAAPEFTELKISGAGDVKSLSTLYGQAMYLQVSGASNAILKLDYQQFVVDLSGASDAKISGRVDSIYVQCSGASDFDAFNAKNTYASVQASGASDVKLNTDSTIVADLTGSSALKYKKNPKYKRINANESVLIGQENQGIYISENQDTIRMSGSNRKTEIIVQDKDDSITIRKHGIVNDFVGNWAGIEMGINGFLDKGGSLDVPQGFEFLELKYEKSINFNINFFQQSFSIIGENVGLVTGLGIQWYNYRFQDNMILNADSGFISGAPDTNFTKSYSKSKLTASYLVIPILLEFQTNSYHGVNSFHVSVGVIGGVRLGSHTKNVYSSNGGNHKPKSYDDFDLQPFKLDATARIGWGPLNIYANYSLIEMFRNDRSPELYPFTIGLILPFSS